jgi:hypothetical protein
MAVETSEETVVRAHQRTAPAASPPGSKGPEGQKRARGDPSRSKGWRPQAGSPRRGAVRGGLPREAGDCSAVHSMTWDGDGAVSRLGASRLLAGVQ